MSIAEKFKKFNQNIKISDDDKWKISYRYKQITKRLNLDFWNSDSEIYHSLYVGSYGRGTAIHVSDIDILFQLPFKIYQKYNNYKGNRQSALLQAVKESLKKTYSTSYIKGDGQVVGIDFSYGISFEIVPCFLNEDGSFTYPDTHNRGSWRITNPKPEIEEIKDKDKKWNGNLKNLCRMARAWKDEWDVPIGGLLIDTLAYNFLRDWEYRDKSYFYYDWMIRDFFEFLTNQDENQQYWRAVGSGQYILRKGKFEYKTKQCYKLALEAIEYEQREYEYSANQKWKEIFGNKFIS